MCAAVMLCTSAAVSCGEKEKTKTPQTADQLLTNSYKSVELTAPEGVSGIQGLTYLKESEKVLVTCYDSDYNTVLYTTDLEFTDYTKLETNLELNENASTSVVFAPVDDGSLYAVITTVTHGDISEPDWNDPDFDYENFDFDAYEAAAEYFYSIAKLDADGKLVSENPIEDIEKYNSSEYGIYLSDVLYCGDDKLFVGFNGDETAYVIINGEGKIEDEIDLEKVNWINYMGKDRDGNIVCTYYGDNGEEICDVDLDKKTFGDTKVELGEAGGYSMGSIISGTGDYKLYIPMSTGLYGLKDDDSFEEIINWIDSDINGEQISAVLGLDNGDFIVYENNWETNEVKLSRLTKRDVSELADTKVMTIGLIWSDSSVTSKITEFNKTSDEYRIKIKDYSEFDVYNEETEKYDSTSIGQLKNDIISGNAPDMICIYNKSTIDSFASKGVFTDLYTLMENDSELNKDMILPNILTACESDGKLYSLPSSFSVQTLAAKTKFVSADKQNWTMDDMIETYNNLPDGMKMFKGDTSKMQVYNSFWYSIMNDFIDYENKSCSFDSPEFIKFLEFCNNFPDEGNEPDWESMTDEEMNQYWNDREVECINDKALLDSVWISSLRDYSRAKQGSFGDDITLVGVPSSDGQGATLSFNYNFAILSDSGCKDAAWAFIKEFFTEEEQEKAVSNYGNMPVTAAAFEKAADECMNKPYYLDENGEKVEYDDTWYIGDREITLEPLTQEERDFLADYVTSITKVSGDYDQNIQDICDEEVQAYFAGEKSAEDAAKMMQNRVSILISEQN